MKNVFARNCYNLVTKVVRAKSMEIKGTQFLSETFRNQVARPSFRWAFWAGAALLVASSSPAQPLATNICNYGCFTIYNPNDIVETTCSNSLPVYYSVGVTDVCCSTFSLVTVPPSGSVFPLGTTTVTSTVTDCSGTSNTCTFNVTVLPGTGCATNCLEIECPTNKTVSCDATNWSFDLPIVLASCCGSNYSIKVNGSDVTSNAGPCSINVTRNWLITDCKGQSNFCSQTVTISPPDSYTLTLQSGYNLIAYQFQTVGANVAFTNGGAQDFDAIELYNCAGTGSTGGGYTLYYFDSSSPTGFDDQNGNPVAAPLLTSGTGMFYQNNSGVPETITFTGTPVCPPSPSPLCPCGTLSLVSYELDCPGTYEDITGLQPQPGAEVLTWNGSGYNTDTFNGTSWSHGAPVLNVGEAAFVLVPCITNCLTLTCPPAIRTSACTGCAPVSYAATVTDTCCSNVVVTYLLNGVSIGTNYCFPVGVNTVDVVASDSCSNTAACSFTVTVLPCGLTNCISLVAPAPITVQACGSNCVPVKFGASVVDYCCSNLQVSYQFAGAAIGTNYCFPVGQSTVSITATDGCGNAASSSFTVTVLPLTNAPSLSAPTNVTLCAGTGVEGRVIVDSDEWDNSDAGFAYEGDGAVYATNCANYLTGNGASGRTNILICSHDFSLTETDLWTALTGAGYHVTYSVPPLPALATLLAYNAVYLSGDALTPAEIAELQSYICDGGGVYIAAGTGGPGGAAGEAAQWNSLVNGFGLNLAGVYDGVSGDLVVPTTLTVTPSPVMAGVGVIYNNNGNNLNVIAGYPQAQIVARYGTQGLIGVSACTATVGGGCSLMPDLSGLVTYAGGSFTQSIPPGTVICTNTTVLLSVTNACGQSTNLTIPVTLVNCASNCLSLQCATNKTVPCGSAWKFDAPIATTCCTNLTYTLLSSNIILTTSCKTIYAGVWQVTDSCSNSSVCTQLVTVVNSGSPVSVPGIMLDYATLTDAGVSFAGGGFTFVGNGSGVQFEVDDVFNGSGDSIGFDGYISSGGPFAIGAITITGSFQTAPVTGNGILHISDGVNQLTGTVQWMDISTVGTSGVLNLNGVVNLTGIAYPGTSLDLQSLVASGSAEVDLTFQFIPGKTLTQLVAAGGFSDFSGTIVGSPVLTTQPLISCSTNKTIQCGGAWSFDPPLPVGGCCTNWTIRVLNTTTNDSAAWCATNYTRTWQVTDCCSNTAICSQTVTVMNNNPPVINCVSNKTVQCGTAWSFDTPTAYDGCSGSNVLITVARTLTNGVCPKVITRTWLAIDACGNTNTCSQMVTVVDTTAPIITCETNTVIVTLNSNCQLVIPPIKASATDNCTSASQLIYRQSPTNGTVVNGTSKYVTVTVTDLCGNSNECQVLVSGRYPPPVINCPGVVTASNCIVPNVLSLVSATGCNGGKAFVFSQTPLPGTPLGPGSDTITVTVTGQGGSDSCFIAVQYPKQQSFLNVLTNTGVNVSGALLAQSAVDPHYTLGPVPAGTVGYTAPHAVAVTNLWSWLEVTPHVSEWIAPATYVSPNWFLQSSPGGYYTYTNQFVLPVGAALGTASIAGRWAADDGAVKMLINNNLTGNSISTGSNPNYGFSHWTPFAINSGFVSGLNTIIFVVTNANNPSPTGLRVEYTNAVFNCSTCAPPNVVWMTPSQSLPQSSAGTFTVNVAGTGPLTYQWYHNNNPIGGANGPTLTIRPVTLASAGTYYVRICNACGCINSPTAKLTVTTGPAWNWAWWNFQNPADYLAATYGPDLILSGTNTLAIASGSTLDFGMQGPAGGVANVLDVPPLTSDTSIQVPEIAPTGSNSDTSYSLIMDIYEPDTSLGTPSTLCQTIPCCVSNLSSGGQDGVTLTLDASNELHITGSAAGVPFDTGPAAVLPVDAWNRVAFVVDDPQDGLAVSLSLYVNGQSAASLVVPTPVGLPVNWSNGAPILLSRQTGDAAVNGEFYAASIQFHAVALSSQAIAGMGSPGTSAMPGNDTSVGAEPVLTAVQAGGSVTFTWTGSSYVLQESPDLTSGDWTDSVLPFTEAAISGVTQTTATVTPDPAAPAPAKFYRLIFRP